MVRHEVLVARLYLARDLGDTVVSVWDVGRLARVVFQLEVNIETLERVSKRVFRVIPIHAPFREGVQLELVNIVREKVRDEAEDSICDFLRNWPYSLSLSSNLTAGGE